MLDQLQTQLVRKGISVDKLLDSLTQLSTELKMEYETLLRQLLQELQKPEQIQEIFRQLRLLIHFTDYHLLKHLITMFGSDELKSDMLSYETNVDDFMRNTTIEAVIDHWPGKRLPAEDFKKLWMKISDDMQTYTLQKLNELRRKHSCHLQLSVILSGIVDIAPAGSFFVAWAVPTWAIDEVTTAIHHVDPSFYEREHIFMIILNDKLVYLSNSTQKVCIIFDKCLPVMANFKGIITIIVW